MKHDSEAAGRSIDALDESTVCALEQLLQEEPGAPAGLVARMQARVARARRAAPLVTAGQRVVIGAMVFSATAYAGTPTTLFVSFIAATLYAFAAERSRERERPID